MGALSTVLFNLTLEKIIMEAGISRKKLIFHKKYQCLAFADEVASITRIRGELARMMVKLVRPAQKNELESNKEKIIYM